MTSSETVFFSISNFQSKLTQHTAQIHNSKTDFNLYQSQKMLNHNLSSQADLFSLCYVKKNYY